MVFEATYLLLGHKFNLKVSHFFILSLQADVVLFNAVVLGHIAMITHSLGVCGLVDVGTLVGLAVLILEIASATHPFGNLLQVCMRTLDIFLFITFLDGV